MALIRLLALLIYFKGVGALFLKHGPTIAAALIAAIATIVALFAVNIHISNRVSAKKIGGGPALLWLCLYAHAFAAVMMVFVTQLIILGFSVKSTQGDRDWQATVSFLAIWPFVIEFVWNYWDWRVKARVMRELFWHQSPDDSGP